jgi:hypothetical protein
LVSVRRALSGLPLVDAFRGGQLLFGSACGFVCGVGPDGDYL